MPGPNCSVEVDSFPGTGHDHACELKLDWDSSFVDVSLHGQL